MKLVMETVFTRK